MDLINNDFLNLQKKRGGPRDLIELINKKNNDSHTPFQVISVCGQVGDLEVAMASIVKNNCDANPESCKNFRYRAWVKLRHPFSHLEFMHSLLDQLFTNYCLQHGSYEDYLKLRGGMGNEDLVKKFMEDLVKKVMSEQRYLVFLEDVCFKDDWDAVRKYLPDKNNGSRIVVHTQQPQVASFCVGKSHGIREMELFSADRSFRVLFDEAFKWPGRAWPSGSEPSHAEIERAKFILHKCGGLPKVIVAVAKFVADGRWIVNWDYFMKLLEDQSIFVSLRGLFSWVHSYFHSCPDSLKPCIFYLSIFPVNHKIRRRRLVLRWIAEGYSTDTKEMTADKNGEKYFNELCNLNMIQVPGSTSMTYLVRIHLCQVNGFFREYIKSRSMEEDLVFELDGHCSVNLQQHKGRHLSIGSTWDRDMSVYQSIDFSRLRSLTVFGKWQSFFISDKMKLLRVLDLEDALSVTDGDLELMVKLLPRLRFLSLRGRKEITRLPDSLGGLRQLQTLDIRHTSIVTLPQCITKLQKLQHIRAGTTVQLDDDTSTVESLLPAEARSVSSSMGRQHLATLVSRLRLPQLWTRRLQQISAFHNGGIEAPRGIGNMMALQNISVIDVSVASGQEILEELKNITQLRKLGVSGVKLENSKELRSAISGHPHLETLSVWMDKNQDGCLDTISHPPEELHSLKLYGCVDKVPLWLKLLPSLGKLKLQMDMITQDAVDFLASLPWLHTLCLRSKEFQYEELQFRGPFRRLHVLEIACNCRLDVVTFGHRVMPRLQALKIQCSNNVSTLKFSGLKELADLRAVSLSGSYNDKVKKNLQTQIGEHKREIIWKEQPDGR